MCSKKGAVHMSPELSCSPFKTKVPALIEGSREMTVHPTREPIHVNVDGPYLESGVSASYLSEEALGILRASKEWARKHNLFDQTNCTHMSQKCGKTEGS